MYSGTDRECWGLGARRGLGDVMDLGTSRGEGGTEGIGELTGGVGGIEDWQGV